jgi:AraC-like DNA-binding protein
MPFAPKIRKDILQALDEEILPQLTAQRALQVLAEPPFDKQRFFYEVEQEEPLPDSKAGPLQVVRQWPEESMTAARGIHIGIVYKGASDIKIGVTQSQADELTERGQATPGIIRLRIPALAVQCFPHGVPGFNYQVPLADAWPGEVRELNLIFDNGLVSPFLTRRTLQNVESTHHLQVNDPLLAQMGEIYLDELRQRDDGEAAQSLLFTMMHRLRRYFLKHPAILHNSCFLEMQAGESNAFSATDLKNHRICLEVIDYAQTHLNTPLTIHQLAEHVCLSPHHLNRIFKQHHYTTVMRYIHNLRMQAAQQILIDNRERISDVALLIGYNNAENFSTAFRKYSGTSPQAFRQQHAHL